MVGGCRVDVHLLKQLTDENLDGVHLLFVDPCLSNGLATQENEAVRRFVNDKGGTLVCNGFSSFNVCEDFGESFKDRLMNVDTIFNDVFRYVLHSVANFALSLLFMDSIYPLQENIV